MALSNDDIAASLDFFSATLNDVQVAITNLASKQQLRQLTLLKQKDIDDIKLRLDALEADVALLKQR